MMTEVCCWKMSEQHFIRLHPDVYFQSRNEENRKALALDRSKFIRGSAPVAIFKDLANLPLEVSNSSL